MAQKATNIDDVKRPDKVTPEATARPILVTNRPTMTIDPMMAPPAESEKAQDAPDESLAHTAKTITPPGETTNEATGAPDEPESTATPAPEATNEPEAEAKTTGARPSVPALPVAASSISAAAEDTETAHDPDAAVSAEEAAAAEAEIKREQELETLIDSGKYAVPVDAVQRKRSRLNALLLGLFAVLLALTLVDMVADVGIIKLPGNVPHTHFFSGR